MKRVLFLFAVLSAAAPAVADEINQPGVGSGGGARYATDAYPGFDRETNEVSPEKKEPKWFACINGPVMTNAAEQLVYAAGLIREESYAKAARQLDALVREWPAAPEAPKAQHMLAELLLSRLDEYEDAFAEYRYLLDFYSLQCDYEKISDKLYQVANYMRKEGKRIFFIRFNNTVDVRRAFETCVLRAPGAKWVPEAMLTIGSLREEEGKYAEAVKVYENLRNVYGDTPEAKKAFLREAEARMALLRDHGYNRERCRDTVDFLKMALRGCEIADVETIKGYLAEAELQVEEEAFAAARFYDSSTRTRRSAKSAYARYLADYPNGAHAEAAQQRISELDAEEAKP